MTTTTLAPYATTLSLPAHQLRPGDRIDVGLEDLIITRVDHLPTGTRIVGVLGADGEPADLEHADPDLVTTIRTHPEASFAVTRKEYQ